MKLSPPDLLNQLFWQRFGRSARAPLDVTRVLFGIAGALPFAMTGTVDRAAGLLSVQSFGLFTVWALLVALAPLLSWRLDVMMRRGVLAIDFAMIASLIAIQHPMIIYSLPYAFLLFLNLAADPFRYLQRFAAFALVVMVAVFGFRAPPLLDGSGLNAGLLIERGLFMAMSVMALVAYVAQTSYRQRFRLWAEGLLIAGTHARAVPLIFIAQQLATQFRSSQISWIENPDATTARVWHYNGDALVEQPLPEHAWKDASAWLHKSRTFLFDARAERLLRNVEARLPQSTPAASLSALTEALALPPYGASFPIRLSDVEARVFIGTQERPSFPALTEAVYVGRAVEAVFERFMFQNAWRGRAVAEARLELGADLHDTVLQTMASLRMQIAGLLARPHFSGDPQMRGALDDLQTTVAEEQRTFREILNETRRAAREPVDLVGILSHRISALSTQWSIECDFQPSAPFLMVDAEAAVEVEFIIREVISNAVQHARAKRLNIRVSLADQALMLSVRSLDRLGREAAENEGSAVSSRSLARRLTYLGASAYADDTSPGGLISIRIPMSRE